jgi:hypothetical protein
MLKYIIIGMILAYVFRRFLFFPINQDVRKQSPSPPPKQDKKLSDKMGGEFTNFEEIK